METSPLKMINRITFSGHVFAFKFPYSRFLKNNFANDLDSGKGRIYSDFSKCIHHWSKCLYIYQ